MTAAGLRSSWAALLGPCRLDPHERDAGLGEVLAGAAPAVAGLPAVLARLDELDHRVRAPRAVRLAAWAAVCPDPAAWARARLPRLAVPEAEIAHVVAVLAALCGDPTSDAAIDAGAVDAAVLRDARRAPLGDTPSA